MQQWQLARKQAGVAVFEMVAAIVVVALIVGAGVFIAHHKSTTTTTSNTQAVTGKPGTIQYVDQITNNAAATETNTDNSTDSQYQQAATSDNSAMSNLGGAYNESTL